MKRSQFRRYISIFALVVVLLFGIGCGQRGEEAVVSGSDMNFSAEIETDSEEIAEFAEVAAEEDVVVEDTTEQETEAEAEEPNSRKDKKEEQKKDEDKKEEETAKKPAYPYYIEVNRKANCITIYTYDENGEYTVPVKAMACSVGRGGNTPTGTFKSSTKYRWHTLNGGVYGQYCTRITGHVLFHSVPYRKQSNDSLIYSYYNKLGSAASAGCIRLTCADAKWIYDNCKSGTIVKIFDGSGTGPLGKPGTVKIDANSPNRGWDPTDPDPKNPWSNQAPVLAGAKDITVERGNSVDLLAGITATDYKGTSITPTVSGSVDIKTCGTYTVTYTATDANGKSATATANVTVKDTTAPTIKWNGTVVTVRDTDSRDTMISAIKATLSATDAGEALGKSALTVDIFNVVNGSCTAYATDAYGNRSSVITVSVHYVTTQPEQPDPEPPTDPGDGDGDTDGDENGENGGSQPSETSLSAA